MRARHPKLNHSTLALAGLIASMASAPASADTCIWNTAAGNWAALVNWTACVAGNGNPAQTPGTADTATIGATGVVTLNTGQQVLNLNNAGQINIDAFGLNLVGGGTTTNTGVINVGGASTANIGISAGHNLNNTGGVINIGNGSVVNQFGSTVRGGTIHTSGTGTLAVQGFSASNFLDGVTLNGNMNMVSAGQVSQRIVNGLTLNGTINVGSGSFLNFHDTQTLSGGGAIVFDGNGSNKLNVDGSSAGPVLTIGAGIAISGEHATIGGQYWAANGGQSIVNNGSITASVNDGLIEIVGGSLTNNGTVGATNGGVLRLSTNYTSTGSGVLATDAISRIEQNGVSLSGTVNTSGDFRPINFSANNFLDGVTLNGNMNMVSSGQVSQRVVNGLTLNGTINVGSGSYLNFQNSQTLSGNGAIVFDANGSNKLNVDGALAGPVLTIGSGIAISGERATIGGQYWAANGGQGIVNNGSITASVNGGLIEIVGGPLTNNGTVGATNGGVLRLSANYAGTGGGVLVADAQSRIEQNAVTLSGTVNTTGEFRVIGFNANNVLDNVTLNGDMNMVNGGQVSQRIVNGLTANGTINVGSGSYLNFQGTQTLGGNATVVFDANGSNRINVDGTSSGPVLTIASTATIRGHTGTIGGQYWAANGGQSITNNGRIAADVAGGTITIAGGPLTNNNLVEAQNGGVLRFNSNYIGHAGSALNAGAGSRIEQGGVTMSGMLNVSGDFLPIGFSAANILDGVTLNGSMNMVAGGQVSQRVVNGIVLNGTINVGSGSYLNFQDSQTLSGNGAIVFDSNGGNRLNVDGTAASPVLTIGSGIAISGDRATIGGQYWFANGGQSIVNNGSIRATVAGGQIEIVGSPLTNNGTVGAANGGVLRLSSNYVGNAGSQMIAGVGSTIDQNATTLGGQLNLTGTLRAVGGFTSNNFLSGVTLNGGVMEIGSAGNTSQRVVGGLALNGSTVSVSSGSYLNFQDTQTLSGNGTIVFDSNGSNRLNIDGAAGSALTIANGVTISGSSATIGGQFWQANGGQTLINNGTINATGAGNALALVIPVTGTGTLAVNGGTIALGGASTQGVLAVGASGTLATNNHGLTLTGDYTNAQAGTGNGFDRRAGVTGTGAILAGGNAAQAITGAGVTNGNTTDATLTIGNLRVGTTSFNYQVANTGNTGPTLRGAIQTEVNGGNITDARLSGSGVTAANYNAGAPGGNSGNQTITFTAAAAGALSPLTGQAINLRSNFENIADQKLNIVMAGDAAAYNAAVGSAAPSPVTVANQRVGGSNSAVLTVTNAAAGGAFSEDLRASFGSNGGAASNNGGVINALVAGNSDGSAMRVGVDTASAGAKLGSVTLNYQTTGTVNGVSNGLGIAGANAPQVVNVSGNVYQAAAGALQTAPLNFGTLQVGQSISQDLVVRNTATGAAGFVEDLHASFGAAGNGQISGTGSLSSITAGNNSTGANGTMTVTVNGTIAGALNSGIAVNYTSAGAVAGVSNGLGTLAVGSENYGVNGTIGAVANVINQASPLVNTGTINLGAMRVGAAAPSGTVSVTNLATAAPQAALNAAIAPTSGPVTASGGFNLLAPGATNNGSLVVGLNTGTAGNFTGANAGTATISFVSDASNVGGCGANCQLNLASKTVSVEGKVYAVAAGQLATVGVNFGVVRVGDTVNAQNITINNTAAVAGLNDTLRATLSSVNGPYTGNGGSVGGIAAQGSGILSVGLSTASAGIFSQTGSVGFASQNADMADTSGGASAALSLFAQVNNLANGDFDLLGGVGTLTQNGDDSVLDLGTINVGDAVAAILQFDNDVTGPADDLSGAFDLSAADDFTYGGWNAVANLAAGQASGGLNLNWLAAGPGLFTDTIVFNGRGTNASDAAGLGQTRRLIIQANVVNGGGTGNVPEPGTVSLLLGAAIAGWVTRRRSARRAGRAA